MVVAKKVLFLLSVAALVTACGGGGGGDGSSGNGGTTTTQTGTQTGGGSTPVTDNGTPLEETGNPPVDNDPDGGNAAPSDQQLTGRLSVVANQVVYIRTDRTSYLPVSLSAFESDEGVYDIAPGSTGGDAGTQVPPPAIAPAAPIAAFGIRVDQVVKPSAPNQELANQTVIGRVAVELRERDDSPGIFDNEVAEIMKFVIDRVELRTDADKKLAFIGTQAGAQMHVYGRNAAGLEVRATIPVPAGALRLLPMSQVPSHNGDTDSVVLLMDFETAFSQADLKLVALENITGHFAAHLTVSAAELIRPAADATADSPALDRKILIGREITVNEQPPVNGAGISGNAWIRMDQPQ